MDNMDPFRLKNKTSRRIEAYSMMVYLEKYRKSPVGIKYSVGMACSTILIGTSERTGIIFGMAMVALGQVVARLPDMIGPLSSLVGQGVTQWVEGLDRYRNSPVEIKYSVGMVFSTILIATSERTGIISGIAMVVFGQVVARLPDVVNSLYGLIDPLLSEE